MVMVTLGIMITTITMTTTVAATRVMSIRAITATEPPTMTWLPIQYRGFWDVPRAFLVERSGDVYYFDAPFNDRADEYADRYSVYRLPRAALPSPCTGRRCARPTAACIAGRTPALEL